MMDHWMSVLLVLFCRICFGSGCSTNCCEEMFTDCQDYLCVGHTTSGVYRVTPRGTCKGFDVYCDMTTDGGGWLVFQRRINGSEDFYREWSDYELGFGMVVHEYWLGFLALKQVLYHNWYELRIDLEDWNGESRYAQYNFFDVSNYETNYTLKLAGYHGNAGDAMKLSIGHQFSTYDKDNDRLERSCAEDRTGAWWYNKCGQSNLNGDFKHEKVYGGIRWDTWVRSNHSLKAVEMKVRRH